MNTFVIIIVTILVIVNVIAIFTLIYSLISGSYNNYVEKRKQHLEQIRRVQNNLN